MKHITLPQLAKVAPRNRLNCTYANLAEEALERIAVMEAQAAVEIKTAWEATEKPGLTFGKVLYEWREKFKVEGFRGNHKGHGISTALRTNGIPRQTAYDYIHRYEESIGKRTAKATTEPRTLPADVQRNLKMLRSLPVAQLRALFKLKAVRRMMKPSRSPHFKRSVSQL